MFRVTCLACALWLFAATAGAAEPELSLTLEGHRFSPVELTAKAGQKLRLVILNKDKTAEEFESYDLNREKLVAPGSQIVVYVGPLSPGRYDFFGDFNPTTARGVLVVTP
jgi:Cupredoxin-like domain